MIEFKSDRNCLDNNEIIDAVVAFANTDGGDLYIGVEDDGTITGDVDYENVAPKASYITPVPGGVGPMTIAMLLNNVVKAAKIEK